MRKGMIFSVKSVEWEKMCTFDKMGKIFYDGDYCYRGIYRNPNNIKRVRRLFESGLIEELVKKEMILPIAMTDDAFCDSDEFGLILKSKRIRNVLYPTEWTYSMMLEAAKLMIKMEKVLLKYHSTFLDYHPYNIVFDKVKAYHVDLGSIGAYTDNSRQEFIRAIEERYYRPLYMWNKKGKSIAEIYLLDKRIDDTEWGEYLFGVFAGKIIQECRRIISSRTTDISLLWKKVNALPDFTRKTEDGHWNWSNYQDSYIGGKEETIQATKRFRIIAECLKRYEITVITELAANQGAFSQYCLENGIISESLAIDYDEWAVDKMWKRLREKKPLLSMTVGVVDLVTSNSRNYKKPSERMKNEAVVAMALIHHLVLSQGLTIAKALDTILSYGERYAFIEFMPLGLYSRHAPKVGRLPKEYTTENFRNEFCKRCTLKEEIKINNNRILFIGEIKGEEE